MDYSLTVARQHLKNIRQSLLQLHKSLLDSERLVYEQLHGRVQSSGEFLQLVLGHEWFSWLRPMSQLIVQMDEALSIRKPATLEQIYALIDAARELLQVSEQEARQRYQQAIERDPKIAQQYEAIAQLLATPL